MHSCCPIIIKKLYISIVPLPQNSAKSHGQHLKIWPLGRSSPGSKYHVSVSKKSSISTNLQAANAPQSPSMYYRHSDVPFFQGIFQGIVQVTSSFSKYRNSSFLSSFFSCWNCYFFCPFSVPLPTHQRSYQPLIKQTPLVYSGIDFTLFYCSIELFDTFLL